MTQTSTRARRRTGNARPLWWTGLVLVLGGLVALGWVAWQLYGTNYVSKREQAAAVQQLQQAWAAEGPAPGTSSGQASDAESTGAAVRVDGGLVTGIVRIPRFGDDYQVPLLEGTSDAALASGFGRFETGARPGGRGNFAVAAHRITHGEPLRDMPSLQVGDDVQVVTKKWTYTYELVTGGDDLVVPFTTSWVLDPLPTNPDGGVQPPQAEGQRLLTLTTCSELFHTDNRMIAFGVLADRQPTAAPA